MTYTEIKEIKNKKYYYRVLSIRNKENFEKISIRYKNWSEKNKNNRREYHTKWREKNKESYQEYKRVYEKTKKDSDPKYRLASYTRTAIYTSLKERNINKYKNTFELLPYTLEELIIHLESKFKDGMTWTNYGKWHVDHIKPMSLFKFKNSEDKEFQECWSLKNLQPLWGDDNLSKGSKYL
jgi:5-methylcytosine-specific restriction endonuclease McrA